MRVKKKKHGAERLEACGKIVIKDLRAEGNTSQQLFGNDNPIRIEIGCGKGDFIVGTAAKEPDVNFLALEKVSDVLMLAAEKVKKSELSNIRVCCVDAKELAEIFPEGSIDRIYLNFSDPWPKVRHHLRRLSSRVFLEKYSHIFREDCSIYMRTDNQGLYIYSLMSFSEGGYVLSDITFDLHSTEDELITTEYEDKFSSKGMPIYAVVATKKCVKK